MTRSWATLILLLTATGCATHRAAISTYRLIGTPPAQIMIPPGVAKPELSKRTFDSHLAPGRSTCTSDIPVQTRRRQIRVTVTQEMLRNRPAGWLSKWAAGLESQGCVAPGAGSNLAEQIAEALPLEPNQKVHLLYSNQLDIIPQMRIEVTSPILRDRLGPVLESVQTSGRGTTISATIKSSDNLLGYEMAAYSVQAKTNGVGLSIVPLYVDRHIGSEVERRPQPDTDYFHFARDAALFRVFYEAQQTEYTALVIAADTRAELDRLTETLESGPAACEKLNSEMCVAVPREVAINGLVRVTVNGNETWVNWGTNVGGVIRAAGERNAAALLPKLRVFKPYRAKLAEVKFDPASPAIFNLIVTGGEVVAWK